MINYILDVLAIDDISIIGIINIKPIIQNYECEYEPHNVLEQKRKVIQMKDNHNPQQHIYNRTYAHDLTEVSYDEIMVNTNQPNSNYEVPSYPYANHYIADIMSINRGECTVNESSTCVDGDETPQNDEGLGESITHIDVPDIPQSESDLVYVYVLINIIRFNVTYSECSDNTCPKNTQKKRGVINREELSNNNNQTSKVAYPEVEKDEKFLDDTNGNDTCENGCVDCLSTCYYCRGF